MCYPKLRVLRIIDSGPIPEMRLSQADYSQVIERVKHARENLQLADLDFPSFSELVDLVETDRETIWMFVDQWRLDYECQIQPTRLSRVQNRLLTYIIEPGFAYDKISTPGFMRNNYAKVEKDAVAHDANFSCKYLKKYSVHQDEGFRFTNLLFKKAMLYRADSYRGRRRARIFARIVNSMIGQAKYVKNKRATWHNKTVQFYNDPRD